jgi:hypothetical protein
MASLKQVDRYILWNSCSGPDHHSFCVLSFLQQPLSFSNSHPIFTKTTTIVFHTKSSNLYQNLYLQPSKTSTFDIESHNIHLTFHCDFPFAPLHLNSLSFGASRPLLEHRNHATSSILPRLPRLCTPTPTHKTRPVRNHGPSMWSCRPHSRELGRLQHRQLSHKLRGNSWHRCRSRGRLPTILRE